MKVIKIDPDAKYIVQPPEGSSWEDLDAIANALAKWWTKKDAPFLLLTPDFKLVRLVDDDAGMRCPACGQIDVGQTGEHPCDVCGLPIAWDDVEDNDDESE